MLVSEVYSTSQTDGQRGLIACTPINIFLLFIISSKLFNLVSTKKKKERKKKVNIYEINKIFFIIIFFGNRYKENSYLLTKGALFHGLFLKHSSQKHFTCLDRLLHENSMQFSENFCSNACEIHPSMGSTPIAQPPP